MSKNTLMQQILSSCDDTFFIEYAKDLPSDMLMEYGQKVFKANLEGLTDSELVGYYTEIKEK